MEIVKYLIESCHCDPNCKNEDGLTPLHYAAYGGHMEIVKHLIESCHCDPNCKNEDGLTPLHYAAYGGQMEIVKHLIESCHCDPNCKDEDGLTPLPCATYEGHMEIVKYLIETCHCDPNCKDKYALTQLHYATYGGHMEIVKYLIESCHCDPNCKDGDEKTPLHNATDGGHMEIVKHLIESCHCDPNCKDKDARTPLHCATDGGHMEIVKYLIESCHCDPNCKDGDEKTPLHYATDRGGGHMEIVKYLIESCHCDPNCKDQHEKTPLHYATDRGGGHMEIVKYLIESCHCDPNCKDQHEKTPLHYATDRGGGHMEIVKYLIESCHCDPNCKDGDEKTPLHYATDRGGGHMEIVKYLIESCHCDPNCKDQHEKTPLHYATDRGGGHMEIVKYLIESCHCDPNCKDRREKTTLHYATDGGHMEVVKYLIENFHCDPNCKHWYEKKTPLHYATAIGHMEIVKYLIETCHCDPNCEDWISKTPLHYATDRGHMEVVKYLIETCHCDPNRKDKYGTTPLHTAVQYSRRELVKYLLHEGQCNPNCKSKDGSTPLDLAVGDPEISRDLVKAGANATTKPPQPPVKVFIVGNPSAGKSSLTKALQRETSALGAALASITGPRLVSDVEEKTAGIVPCQFTSKKYGHVTFYDFAGQQEYYASHAALLQNSISSSAPLFIIVVNLCDSEEDIKQKLVYWISFLENQCTSVATKPHVFIVGSHSDVVRSRGEDPRAKVNMEFLQAAHESRNFHISKFIPSRDIIKLSEQMKETCDTLRKQYGAVYHLHLLFTFLLKEFDEAVRFEKVLKAIQETYHNLLTVTSSDLHSDLCELNDMGYIIYLKGSERWIVLDQAALLSRVQGVLFAPADFKQHREISNATGVVPVSRITELFSPLDTDMLVQVLCYLEFCCEIHDHNVLQLINQHHSPRSETTDKRYLFFSVLVRKEAPTGIWETNPQFPHLCGWLLQCCESGQFLTSQFLQVLLLRLAFYCAMAPDVSSNLPFLQRKCSIWKNGIYWGSRKGVEAIVEIRDPPNNTEVVVMLRCMSGQEVECARLCSTVIQMVLKAKEKCCHKIPTNKFLLHHSQVNYPFNSPAQQDLFDIKEVSRAVLGGEPCVVGSNGNTTKLEDVLLFEPYHCLGEENIRELFDEQDSAFSEVVSDSFLHKLAHFTCERANQFAKIFTTSGRRVGSSPSMEQVLRQWRDNSQGTRKCLRDTLDQFSVFAGRNLMVSEFILCVYYEFGL